MSQDKEPKKFTIYDIDLMVEEIEKLQQENERLRESAKRIIAAKDAQMDRLLLQVKMLTEALEFYADIENWGHIAPGRAIYTVILDDLGDGDYDNGNGTDDMSVGGKRAREALAKCGGGDETK